MYNNSLVVSAFHIPENALGCMYVTAIVHCNSTGFEHVVGMACRVHGGTAATPSAALFVEGRFNYEKRGCRLKNENCYQRLYVFLLHIHARARAFPNGAACY